MFHPLVSFALWTATHAPVWVESPPPAQLPAAPPTEAAKPPKWTGSITAGGIVTTGNSETRSGNATADAVYEREKLDRITLGFLWVYAEEKNTTSDWNLTDRKTAARAKYDYFLTDRTYLYAQVSAESDDQADLALRTTIGGGIGHKFLDGPKWKFDGEGGLSWVDEDYDTGGDKSYLAARLAANTIYEHSKTWSFAHTLELFPSLEDADDFNGRSDLRVKATLTENMLAQAQWVVDYDNTPAAGKDRVDQRYLVSVGWKF